MHAERMCSIQGTLTYFGIELFIYRCDMEIMEYGKQREKERYPWSVVRMQFYLWCFTKMITCQPFLAHRTHSTFWCGPGKKSGWTKGWLGRYCRTRLRWDFLGIRWSSQVLQRCFLERQQATNQSFKNNPKWPKQISWVGDVVLTWWQNVTEVLDNSENWNRHEPTVFSRLACQKPGHPARLAKA